MAVSNPIDNPLRTATWLGAFIVAAVVAFGYVSLEISPVVAGLGFALLVAIAYGTATDGDELSITFALSLIAVIMLIWEYVLPEAIQTRLPFSPLIESADVLTYVVLITLSILVWWVIDARFLEERNAKTPERVADKVTDRFERLIEAYVTMGRIGAALILAGVVIVLSEFGVLAGELWAYVGDAPFIAGNILMAGIGYVALGGQIIVDYVPIVSDLSPSGWAVLALAIIIVAAGVKYAD